MSEQFSNPEQALIERLRHAPQPELSPEVHEIIRVRLLDALNHPPIPAPRPRFFHPVVVIAAVLIVGLVAAALIAGGVLFVLSQQNQAVLPSIATNEPTLTLLPTNTVEPTVTPIPTTGVPVSVSSPVLLQTPIPTVTLTLPATVEITLSPTATVATVIVIQGPVEKIDGNIITIYGIQVQIASNDPILITVKVGDVLRVEGNQSGTTRIIIVATTVVSVNVVVDGSDSADGNVSPPSSGSGEIWSDDGSCAHPPPDWAPANGWRRRCQGEDKEKDNEHDKDDD